MQAIEIKFLRAMGGKRGSKAPTCCSGMKEAAWLVWNCRGWSMGPFGKQKTKNKKSNDYQSLLFYLAPNIILCTSTCCLICSQNTLGNRNYCTVPFNRQKLKVYRNYITLPSSHRKEEAEWPLLSDSKSLVCSTLPVKLLFHPQI